MLVADEPSPAADVGVDGTSSAAGVGINDASALGASGFGSVSTVVAEFGFTGAVGCDAGASVLPALPLSPVVTPKS